MKTKKTNREETKEQYEGLKLEISRFEKRDIITDSIPWGGEEDPVD